MPDEREVRSLITMLSFFAGAAILLIAFLLTVLTGEGWPMLTLVALAWLSVGGLLLVLAMREPS
jgi:VIT1/CCC1 family predicted Fe2+/Mn2+ transporter